MHEPCAKSTQRRRAARRRPPPRQHKRIQPPRRLDQSGPCRRMQRQNRMAGHLCGRITPLSRRTDLTRRSAPPARARSPAPRRCRSAARRIAPDGRTGRQAEAAGPDAGRSARSIASGNFAGCAVAIATTGTPCPGGSALAAAMPIARVRIGEVAGGRVQAADFGLGARIVQPETVEHRPHRGARPRQAPACGRCRESPASCPRSRRIAVQQLEQQALEIGTDLDVHAAATVTARPGPPTCRCWRETAPGCRCGWTRRSAAHRQAHAAGDPGGQHVAEIAGGDAERHLPVRARPVPGRRRRNTGSARRCAPS